MEAPVAFNVAPHKDLDWLPLVDKDFQIKELSGDMNHLQAFFQIRNNHLRNSDIYGIWESNLPRYYLPSVNVFPDIIHQSCANYYLVNKAAMAPSQTVIFYITVESINEMLHFHPTQPLALLSIGFLLEQGSQLPSVEIT